MGKLREMAARKFLAVVAAMALMLEEARGCTNILVSKGASADGSTMIAYNADSGSLHGSLGHYPAADHSAGTMRDIWDWDSSLFLGQIPEASHTFNVVGNANEHGLIIGETTFGGLPSLDSHGGVGIIDYGSLIWITLQRTRTAREAIAMMDDLCTKYGYASDGESFSIADTQEVFLMELMGKGKTEKGCVWVASRVPEGYIGSTANQARTRTFAQDDPDNVLFAKDVVTFAQQQGLYPSTARPEDFSFSDTYDPVSFGGARMGEARVWNIFNDLADPAKINMASYLDYAQGYNLTNRMPLFVPVKQKLSVNDTMEAMRTHFEGTWFDNRAVVHNAGAVDERIDVGAGPGSSPYRWRPLTWKASDGRSFVNERTVGVQQTSWAFVAQSRDWMPAPFQSLFWFAPDDSSTAVRIPLYGGITKIPSSYGGTQGQDPAAAVSYAAPGDAYNFVSMDSAFWIYNLVADLAYGERYSTVYPLVQAEIHKYQNRFFEQVAAMDTQLIDTYKKQGADAAVAQATAYCVQTGDKMTADWRSFWMFLFSRVRDGFTTQKPTLPTCKPGQRKGCTSRTVPNCEATGYDSQWYDRIVSDPANAKHYGVPAASADQSALNEHKIMRMNKMRPPARR